MEKNVNFENKILFIASDNDSAHGAFRSMTALCTILKEKYLIKPTVILRTKKGTGIEFLECNEIPYKIIKSYNWIVPLDYKWNIERKLKWILKRVINTIAIIRIALYARKRNFKAIHINTSYTYVGLYAAKLAKIPCVWHIREMLEEDQNKTFAFHNALSVMKQATRTVAISDFVFQKYKKSLNNLVTIFNGLDEKEYYLQRHLFDKDRVSILLIGNMNANKGQSVLIQAVKILVAQGCNKFHVNFVGTGSREKEYRELVHKLGLNEYFTFHGLQKNVMAFYAKTDIMIMASSAEAFGRTTVEAMMSGCLVIGAECGATPEILDYGHAGLLYTADSETSLAEKILQAIHDIKKSESIAIEGQKFALEYFSVKENADQIYNLYKKIGVMDN